VIATCFSPLSRNRGFGEAIARGATVGDALAASRGVVEGIEATAAACDLARRFGVEMPIAESLREVILGKESLAPMIARLLEREPTKEA
jgi:glycerol-3-phosphate dehydrogenase (NAD(P)+)